MATTIPLGLDLFEKIHNALYKLARTTVKAKFPTVNDCPQELQYLLEDFMQYFVYDNSHPFYKFVAPQNILDILEELEHEDINHCPDYDNPNYLRKLLAIDLAIRNNQLTCTLK